MNTHVKNSPKSALIKTYGKGLIRSYVVSLILFLISAILVTYTGVSEQMVPALVSCVTIVSVAYASIYVSIHSKSKGWVHGAVVGILYMIVIILLSAIFIPEFVLDRVVYYKIGICCVSGVVGGMIGVNVSS
ncbi:TIGR04086 family membrane protein [Serpentinicella sp. ANB-PHB4]|uniref:TIGR04086 family membrane protein n=1 Tax=Serpentinicella sp. ANB-PHB4 TaxID=3074076 RepID=UPI00285879A8|nr:TIGR04086 family membrane protein [Serpentinicella sp. ANB-PHB4]MDR5658061.1 TIGR04086 family membrane protein [Serpentinicella sp. ANB-PHB4]